MKKFILLYFTCLVAFNFQSQLVMKLDEGEKKYAKDSLQEIYFERIFSDEIATCFDVSPEFFIVEWSKYTRKLSKYLHDKEFVWGKKTMGQIEIYFNTKKEVDLMFIYIRDSEFSEERYQELIKHLTVFAKENKFTIDAKIPFTNSGSITFYD